MSEPIRNMSLAAIAQALRDGSLSAVDLTQDCIDAREASLNAYREWTPELALEQARTADAAFANAQDSGVLQGIPISVKDLYGVNGTQTFAGSPAPMPPPWQAEGDLISGLRAQHAVFSGKTHTVEFAFGGLGVNSHWGTPRNPWDANTHRAPGGSSSGAGVSLCEGTALVALGSDTAGSVRIPASVTGNVGLKTSYGRWPVSGIFPLSPTLDTAGILTRSVADTVTAFSAIDPHQRSYGPRLAREIARCTPADFVLGTGESTLWDDCDPGISETVDEALKTLGQAGVQTVSAALPEAAPSIELLKVGSVVAAEIDEMLSSTAPQWRETLDPVVSSRIRDGGSISASEYLHRRRRLRELSRSAAERFSSCQVMVSPTVAVSPPAVEEVQTVEAYRPKNMGALRNTCPANYLGFCAITVPVGLDADQMPVGLQLMAPHGHEEQLLAVAACIEGILGPGRERLGVPPLPNRS